ncbi:hypothetical protein EYF80_029504 [Liparis tanakae]|uniref:Uncharacterized protein n=1 Tax=Liparis tanakae TaxID=230148 RepID=A0A4Z2H3S1_9TELE|nr:hypothetical protein EYF80_029504 [Liparis tanakae]
MLSTKKLTMRRKEMKNSSIQGLLFRIGCEETGGRERKKTGGGGERRGGEADCMLQWKYHLVQSASQLLHTPAWSALITV